MKVRILWLPVASEVVFSERTCRDIYFDQAVLQNKFSLCLLQLGQFKLIVTTERVRSLP